MLITFAVMFVILGAAVIIWGLIQNSLIAFAGVAESVLFIPAVRLVQNISNQNTALRLLEIPLRKAKTAENAARVLVEFFGAAYGIGRKE